MAKEVRYIESDLPTEIPADELQEVVEKAKDWALMHGAAMRSKSNFSRDSLQFAPFILLPSPFPRKEFLKAVELQTVLNELTHRVAHSREFLTRSLKEAVQVDEFTGNLFKIYETVQDEGVTQVSPPSLRVCEVRRVQDALFNTGICKMMEIVWFSCFTFLLLVIVQGLNRPFLSSAAKT